MREAIFSMRTAKFGTSLTNIYFLENISLLSIKANREEYKKERDFKDYDSSIFCNLIIVHARFFMFYYSLV